MAERAVPKIERLERDAAEEPLCARFGGILEGRRTPTDADAERLRALVAELNALGLARADLAFEGGRFTLLFADEELPPARLRGADHDAFVQVLQQLIDASCDPRGVESTLRCTEVFADEVVETLFAAAQGELRQLSRTRPVQQGDRPRALAGGAHARARLEPRQAALLAALFAIVLGLLAWQGGWIERAFSAEAESLAVEPGPFGELLRVEVAPAWGDYGLSIARGKGFPQTTAALDALLATAATPADRAAVNAVGEGGRIYAQLRGADEKVLESIGLELRALLTDETAAVRGRLPGRRAAHSIRLALDAGTTGP